MHRQYIYCCKLIIFRSNVRGARPVWSVHLRLFNQIAVSSQLLLERPWGWRTTASFPRRFCNLLSLPEPDPWFSCISNKSAALRRAAQLAQSTLVQLGVKEKHGRSKPLMRLSDFLSRLFLPVLTGFLFQGVILCLKTIKPSTDQLK